MRTAFVFFAFGWVLGVATVSVAWQVRGPVDVRSDTKEVNSASAPAPDRPALRCSQSVDFDGTNTPRVRREPRRPVDAEAAYHHARMALETARRYGGSTAHKQAWALESIAGYLDVLVCGYVSGQVR
jgi:hypothetical protein